MNKYTTVAERGSLMGLHNGSDISENVAHPGPIDMEFLGELSAAKDIFEFRRLIIKIIDRYGGMTDFSFVRMSNVPDCCKNPLITVPNEHLHIYQEEGYFEDDEMVRFAQALENDMIYQSEIYSFAVRSSFKTNQRERNLEIFDLNRKFGFLDWFCIKEKSACNSSVNVLFCVSRRNTNSARIKEHLHNYEYVLRTLCCTIDYIITQKFPEYFLDSEESKINIDIRNRPLTVLAKMASDYSTKQIASELHCSVSNVQKLATVARESLGCRTNTGAIAEAIKRRIIK